MITHQLRPPTAYAPNCIRFVQMLIGLSKPAIAAQVTCKFFLSGIVSKQVAHYDMLSVLAILESLIHQTMLADAKAAELRSRTPQRKKVRRNASFTSLHYAVMTDLHLIPRIDRGAPLRQITSSISGGGGLRLACGATRPLRANADASRCAYSTGNSTCCEEGSANRSKPLNSLASQSSSIWNNLVDCLKTLESLRKLYMDSSFGSH
jgi:hypothetical protein